MILQRIKVSNWRSLLDDVEIGPFSEGLNVIHAPNGTGKSSLFEAMRRGLFDAHHVTGGEISAVQPWGRDLTPEVMIEFIEGEETWRVEKSFLSGKAAKLSRLEGGSFKPVADGRQADDRIREILSAEAPGRGLSKQEHWGLAQILWAPQGELQLSQISGNASESLKTALGVQVSGNSGGQIEDQIAERYLAFFTKKGVYKSGKNAAPIISLQEKRDHLAEQLVGMNQKYNSFEQAGLNVEDARQRRLQARREANALRETVTTTREKAEAYSKLKAEQSNKREAEILAKERYTLLTDRHEQIQETRISIKKLTKSLTEQSSKLEELSKEEEQAGEDLSEKRTAREIARAKRKSVAGMQKLIDAARDFISQSDTLETLNKRLANLFELQNQMTEAKERFNATLAPSPELLREILKWIRKREQANASLKASQIHLELSPESSIEVTNLATQEDSTIDAWKAVTFSGDDWVDVKIKGFGSIRASGPEGTAQEHRTAFNEASTEIENRTQPFGTDDPDKLQLAREQADQLERDLKTLQYRMDDILAGDEWDVLKSQHAELAARVTEWDKRYPDWKKQPPVLSELQSDFEALSQSVDDEIFAAEDAFESAQSNHSSVQKAFLGCEADGKLLQGKLDSAQTQLEDLSRDGLSDEARKKAISEALMSWKAAREAAEQAEEDLKQFPDDPSKELSILEKQLTALEKTEASARDEEKTAEGLLISLAAEGTYSKLVAAEEEVAKLESSIEQESVRMDAIKLLHETVSSCKNRMVASVAAPVERSATRMLSRIVGPRLGKISLAADFVPEAICPDIMSEQVAIQNLSGGEQEQLYLVARLALAEVLSKHQRQLVVLDDVLNATDAGRLARLLNLMEEVSERLQIVILTCHPERYRALEGAGFFELK